MKKYIICRLIGDNEVGKELIRSRKIHSEFFSDRFYEHLSDQEEQIKKFREIVRKQFSSKYKIINDDEFSEITTFEVSVDNVDVEFILKNMRAAHDYDRVRHLNYQDNNDIFLVTFSTVSRESLENVKNLWIPELAKHAPGKPFILVGTQIEIRDNPEWQNYLKEIPPISSIEGKSLAQTLGAISYVECSTYSGIGVADVFDQTVNAIMYKVNIKEKNVKFEEKKPTCRIS